MTIEQRKTILASAIAKELGEGARLEAQTDYHAVMVKGRRPSHILHLLLTLVTFGLWLIPWVLISAFSGERRRMVFVGEDGTVMFPRG